MKIAFFFFFFFFFLLTFFCLSNAAVQDFCVADTRFPQNPQGYACKDRNNVTVDDFVFTGLRAPARINEIFKAGGISAFAPEFPGVNGLGLAMARLDLEVGGVIPLHSHPGSSELILVTEGTLVAGFISVSNVAYYKALEKGDIMIFPDGLLHFQVNIGKTPATAFVTLNSGRPLTQITSTALFASDLPSNFVEKTTLLDAAQVKKLKALLGGSG